MIKKVSIENFKAIHKGLKEGLPLQPFSVFIGNNGTGKSSVLEALRALQIAITLDLNEAFKDWGGLDKIRNYNAVPLGKIGNNVAGEGNSKPFTIRIAASINNKNYDYTVKINVDESLYLVEQENLACNGKPVFTSEIIGTRDNVKVYIYDSQSGEKRDLWYKHDAKSLLLSHKGSPVDNLGVEEFSEYIENWQFLYLNAHVMGYPTIKDKLRKIIKLKYDGSNIAEFLLWLNEQGPEHLENVIRKMRFVLPYINDLKPYVLEEPINKEVELRLTESSNNSKPLPGWLLSSGTLRILSLLAVFESPKQPSVLFVDEIENSLDPITIGLLLSQIENVFNDKSMQVIATTHSPYFLDLVPLDSIVVVDKENGESNFRPLANETSLNLWKNRFAPGRLYTMGKLAK